MRSSLTSSSSPPDVMPAFAALERMKATRAVPAVVKQIGNPKEPVALAADQSARPYWRCPDRQAAPAGARRPARARAQGGHHLARAGCNTAQRFPTCSRNTPTIRKTQNETIDALSRMPDVKALDAYLDGLAGQDAGLRDQCRKAITAISQPALPLIEAKLDSAKPIPAAAVQELQRIYSSFQPIMHWKIIGPFEKDGPEPVPG